MAEELNPIYYMRDNHTFKLLSGDVDTAIVEIEAEFNAGYTCGMLCSKRPGFKNIHAHGNENRFKFFAECKQALQSALTSPAQSAVPEGYVLVPVEPTEEMKSAGIEVEVYSEVSDSISALTWGEVRAIYRAMLTASQKGDRHTCPVKGEAQADAARAAEKGGV